MKRVRLAVAALLLCGVTAPAFGYQLVYKEQLYPLIHYQLNMYPQNWAENIHWLNLALRADFANPLYALAKIKTPTQWEFYRYLFMMHLNLMMVQQYLGWGAEFDKFHAYFYNYPWKQENLDSLNKAEALFKYALNFWTAAKKWSDLAAAAKFRWMSLNGIEYWQDESYKIQTGSLNFKTIIDGHIKHLDTVRKAFQAMTSKTY